jgi:t-SNARE complex subunit (syntaxin)
VVEGQMASISQANQFIAQNLVKQREDIQQIGDSTLQAETHIVQGNKNLREAAQSGVNFRIFVLLFMLALSFTLLFLHWYE